MEGRHVGTLTGCKGEFHQQPGPEKAIDHKNRPDGTHRDVPLGYLFINKPALMLTNFPLLSMVVKKCKDSNRTARDSPLLTGYLGVIS